MIRNFLLLRRNLGASTHVHSPMMHRSGRGSNFCLVAKCLGSQQQAEHELSGKGHFLFASAAAAFGLALGGTSLATCESKLDFLASSDIPNTVGESKSTLHSTSSSLESSDHTIPALLSKDQAATTWNAYLATSSSASTFSDPTLTPSSGDNQNVTTKRMYFYHNHRIRKPEKFIFFVGPDSTPLGHAIAHRLGGMSPHAADISSFADGETSIQIPHTSVRGKHVYIVQSTTSSDAILQLLLLVTTLRRASAKHVTVVIPYYGYSRQDRRQNQAVVPIAAADVAQMMEEVGVDRVIGMDLHSETLLGFFGAPVEHILPSPVAAAYFYEALLEGRKKGQKITVVASHEGQVERATKFREALSRMCSGEEEDAENIELAVLVKNPNAATQTLVGSVQGRRCIIVDDIVNTGTTMEKSVATLAAAGASSIHAWATHGVFTPAALERLGSHPQLDFLLVSNSVTQPQQLPTKIRVLDLSPLLAEVIARVNRYDSLRGLFRHQRDRAMPQERQVKRYDGEE